MKAIKPDDSYDVILHAEDIPPSALKSKIKECTNFMEYSSPKQLKVVKKEIAWDFIPE